MDLQKVTFSVIMPCYNSESYVAAAIESIVNQTYPNWEYVIINDGSKDGTLDILNRYAEADSRIKVFSKENGGYVSAVNYGLEKITGDYFLMMGSDDTLDTALFENLQRNIAQQGFAPDCIAFRTKCVTDGTVTGGDGVTEYEQLCAVQNTTFKDFSANYPDNSFVFYTRDTSKCYKREMLQNLRYFGRYGIDADGIFSMLLSNRGKSFMCVPCDGYYWTLRSDSVSATTSIEKFMDKINNWKLFIAELEKLPIESLPERMKTYVAWPLHFVVELAADPVNCKKYRRFIKENAKQLLKLAQKYYPACINTPMKIVAHSPNLYRFLYKLRSIVK